MGIVTTLINFILGNFTLFVAGAGVLLLIRYSDKLLEGQSGKIITALAIAGMIAAIFIWRPQVLEFAWVKRPAIAAEVKLTAAAYHPLNDPASWPNPVAKAKADELVAGLKADEADQILRKAYIDALIDAGVPEAKAQQELQTLTTITTTNYSFAQLMAAPLSALSEPSDAPASMIGPVDYQMLVEGMYALPIGVYTLFIFVVVLVAVTVTFGSIAVRFWKWR